MFQNCVLGTGSDGLDHWGAAASGSGTSDLLMHDSVNWSLTLSDVSGESNAAEHKPTMCSSVISLTTTYRSKSA